MGFVPDWGGRLIVQDMGITRLNLPPIPLHASTQMDNRTPQKVKFLAEAGFRQVVLARELTLDEIAKIHAACPETPLEVFVHGALCVSYSGQCYVSQACFGRSANRGECAQFCRLSFDMVDADGKMIARGKHLLSLKDMNQSENLEALLDAGASSLKIEGRLKDVAYVKNVTLTIARNWMRYSNAAKNIYVLLPARSGWLFVRNWTRVSAGALPIISCTDVHRIFSPSIRQSR